MSALNPILVIAAHPDDEVLGCGGTAARLAKEGRDVFFAIMGEGITSRHEQRDMAEGEQLSQLKQNAHAAAKKVGAKNVFQHQLPDNRLDTVPLLEVVKLIEDLVNRIKPRVIYTHHPGDLNVDHGVIYRAGSYGNATHGGTIGKRDFTRSKFHLQRNGLSSAWSLRFGRMCS